MVLSSKTYKTANTKKACLANLKDKSKLTDAEVRYARSIHVARSKEFSTTALANKFDTSVAAMSQIIRGKTYKHVR